MQEYDKSTWSKVPAVTLGPEADGAGGGCLGLSRGDNHDGYTVQEEQADAKPLNTPMMVWFFDKVLNKADNAQDPRLNLVAADLKDPPPVTIINAELDPLRSDGDMLADKMKAAGNDVTHKLYTGVTHEFLGMYAVVAKAKEAQDFAVAQLQKGLRCRPIPSARELPNDPVTALVSETEIPRSRASPASDGLALRRPSPKVVWPFSPEFSMFLEAVTSASKHAEVTGANQGGGWRYSPCAPGTGPSHSSSAQWRSIRNTRTRTAPPSNC